MAARLAACGIETTVIPDAAVFAMMSRVNKVVIGTHAVMANGGLLARSGAHVLAAAAKHHSTPVVVLTGMYKLTPIYAYDQDTHNTLLSPNSVMPYDDGIMKWYFGVCSFAFAFQRCCPRWRSSIRCLTTYHRSTSTCSSPTRTPSYLELLCGPAIF